MPLDEYELRHAEIKGEVSTLKTAIGLLDARIVAVQSEAKAEDKRIVDEMRATFQDYDNRQKERFATQNGVLEQIQADVRALLNRRGWERE